MNNENTYMLYMIAKDGWSADKWHLSTMGFETTIPTKEEGEQISFYKNATHARLYVLDQQTGESILICEK